MLNSLPRAMVITGWIIFAAIFLLRPKPTGKTVARKRDSILGVVLQSIALGLVWIQRPRHMSILSLGFWFEVIVAVLIAALVVGSLWLISRAHARKTMEHHRACARGSRARYARPIQFSATPGHWIGFVSALVFFALGTFIRVRSEEKLLRKQFGAAFDDYARRVPAVLPLPKRS